MMTTTIKRFLINAVLMAVTIAAAIALGSQAPKLLQAWRGNGHHGNYSQHVANQPQRLTLYGTTTCPYCAKARAYLTGAGIAFNERMVDTSKEAEAMYATLHENSVPVLISEKKYIVGFNEKDYAALAAEVAQQPK